MNKPALIYVYDPLCGWCFGFHPVMEKLATRFQDKFSIRVVPGGLAVGENAQPIAEGYGYISGALKQVETATGVQFGENFKLLAEEGSYMYDSFPSCKAQNIVNRLAPELSLQFAGELQRALFVDGKNLNKKETFTELLEDTDVDQNQFLAEYDNEDSAKETYNLFDWCRRVDAGAFPTLLLEIGGEVGVMSKGYRPYDTIESHLHHLIRNYEKLLS